MMLMPTVSVSSVINIKRNDNHLGIHNTSRDTIITHAKRPIAGQFIRKLFSGNIRTRSFQYPLLKKQKNTFLNVPSEPGVPAYHDEQKNGKNIGAFSWRLQYLLNLAYTLPQHPQQALKQACSTAEQFSSTGGANSPVCLHAWFVPPSIIPINILYSLTTYVKIIFFFVFLSSSSYAGIGADLMKFFDRTGAVHNTTASGAYQNQAAGYYSGGGFALRGGTRTAQFATVQMPGFKAGCGGIDAWAGGISHITGKELMETLRTIGASTASYAFMLAVQTVSPQIYNIMNELNALATKINQAQINSCEAAATMLGGVWPKTDQSSQHLCRAMGANLGKLSDWAAARQGCGGEGRGAILKGRSGVYKDMLVGDFNLAWKAIQKNAFLQSDKELAHLFLTLTGSIIVKIEADAYNVTVLPSHADRDQLLSSLLQGGATNLYTCDSGECLNPTLQSVNMAADHALFNKVRALLDSLVNKIYSDQALTTEEIGFLNATRLPIYKMLNVLTAYQRGRAPLDIQQYAELIAVDILYTYVLEIMDIVLDSVVQLRSVQVDEEHISRFLEQLRYARSRILERRKSSFEAMDQALSLIESTQLIEKQLHVMMGRLA